MEQPRKKMLEKLLKIFINNLKKKSSVQHKVKHKDDIALRNLIRKKDVMVLDRGFRDVIKHLEQEYELITLMPCCSLDKQLTTYQANCTRMVTKIRNVIERKNGIFKIYNALEKCRNSQLTHITQDFKNVAAIFFKR